MSPDDAETIYDRVAKLEDEVAVLREEVNVLKKALKNKLARYEVSQIKQGKEYTAI